MIASVLAKKKLAKKHDSFCTIENTQASQTTLANKGQQVMISEAQLQSEPSKL